MLKKLEVKYNPIMMSLNQAAGGVRGGIQGAGGVPGAGGMPGVNKAIMIDDGKDRLC